MIRLRSVHSFLPFTIAPSCIRLFFRRWREHLAFVPIFYGVTLPLGMTTKVYAGGRIKITLANYVRAKDIEKKQSYI